MLRATRTLDSDLQVLDSIYNELSDHMAKGERDEYNPESHVSNVAMWGFFQKQSYRVYAFNVPVCGLHLLYVSRIGFDLILHFTMIWGRMAQCLYKNNV